LFKSGDVEVVFFENTPRMSTYMVNLFVGEFVPNTNGSNVTVYTQKLFAARRKLIQTEAPKYLQVMSDYTGVRYTLPKLDLLFAPCRVCYAMESWGLNVIP
jgi:aminopeptidase N